MSRYDPYAYELQAVAAVSVDHDAVEAFHWPDVPESLLLESGYIVNMEAHRKERLRNGGFRDYGLDGLVKTSSGAFVGIQAKAYGPNSTITMSILGTFSFAVNAMRDVNPNSSGILVHTPEARFVERLAIFLKRGSGNITRKALPFTGEDVRVDSPPAREEPSFVLRPYQVRAVDDIINANAKVALYVSPCGTGKTLVIGTVLSRTSPKVVVIASPLQVSAEQNAERLGVFLSGYTVIRAWSEAGLTTEETLEKALEKAGDLVFISTTFKTLPIVASLCSNRAGGFHLVIDEAHNLCEDKYDDGSCDETMTDIDIDESIDETIDDTTSSFEESIDSDQGLWGAIRSAKRVILMTATPPDFLLEKNSEIHLVHRYDFNEAISDGAICDYRVYIPEISNKNPTSSIEFDGQYESSIAAKASFLVSGMLESGAHRCIVYCGSREECREFHDALHKTCDTYYGVGCVTSSITCDTPVRNRDEILRSFRKDPCFETVVFGDIEHRKQVIRVITSIRILDEAIDIPECDSVFITKCSGRDSGALSPARAVQRICRATRVYPNKTRASIFVWTLDGGDDAGLVNVFSLLRDNDLFFGSKIVSVSRDYDGKHSLNAKHMAEITVSAFNDTFLVRAVTPGESWSKNLAKLVEFMVANKRLPKRRDKCGDWVHTQRRMYKAKTLTSTRISLLEGVDGWRWATSWSKNLANLVEFIAKNKRLPKEREPLGLWIAEQRYRYKKKKISLERIASLEAIHGWFWKREDMFHENLTKLIDYINCNGRLPKQSLKHLGPWVKTQRQMYAKCKLSPERVSALENVAGWKWIHRDKTE